MTSEFRQKMQRSNPYTADRPSTISVPAKDTDAASQSDIPFQPPIDANGNVLTGLDGLAAITRNPGPLRPTSRPMTAKEIEAVKAGKTPSSVLTERERRQLELAGWQNGEPVPDGFADELDKVYTAYVEDQIKKGISLDEIKSGSIEDLPEERQAEIIQWMAQAVEQKKEEINNESSTKPAVNYPKSILSALASLDQEDDAQIPSPEPEQKPAVRSEDVETPSVITETKQEELKYEYPKMCNTCGYDPSDEKVRLTCPHCGGDPMMNPSELEIPLEDKRRFLIAVGTGQPFQKICCVFNNTVELRFRSLTSREYDDTAAWAAVRARELQPNVSFMDRAVLVHQLELRCRLPLQTIGVRGLLQDSPLYWVPPEGTQGFLKDWQTAYPESIKTYTDLYNEFTDIVRLEPLMAAIIDNLSRFNTLEYRMLQEANNTQNFWEGI
jgi:predicted Zn-ribbon and HTH transcriptional regulator